MLYGMKCSSVVECPLMVWWAIRPDAVCGLMNYFVFQPVLHNWCVLPCV